MNPNMKRRTSLLVALLVLDFLFVSSLAWGGEKYPNRPVALIIPMGAGGGFDLTSRAMSSVAPQYLEQPLIVTLKPGGGGTIGPGFVKRAKPDGYTLLFGGTSQLSIAPQIEDAGYTKDDFVPIVKVNHLTYVVAVRADKPWNTLKDLLNHIRANPNKVLFGATGIPGLIPLGNHMLLRAAGIETSPPTVPFKGVGEQVLSLLKGDTDYMIQLYAGLVPFIRSKEIRLLAVMDETRLPFMPDVPTAKELNYDVVLNMWMAILAPKGTPEEVVETLSTAFAKIIKDPSFVAMMQKMDMPIIFENRAKFQRSWDDEYQKYGKLIENLGLRKKK